jgi:hypothetical protein
MSYKLKFLKNEEEKIKEMYLEGKMLIEIQKELIISYRANIIKNSGSAEEHRYIADYIDRITLKTGITDVL